ncbi:MAG TPA: glutathione peroxidase [Sphingomonas sp.]|nr:glutathione peroxidase [Sphingomonas sp.]
MTIQNIPLRRIDGAETRLGDFAGKVLLIVNTASQCGLTPQYAGLEALYEKYQDEGLEVLGFPANDFAGQEPGTDDEIAQFCETQYAVRFPLFAKLTVTGADKHPLYAALVEARPEAAGSEAFRERLKGYGMTPNEPPELLWNFEKFLVGRDGQVVGRFSPDMTPDDDALVTAIERELFASE